MFKFFHKLWNPHCPECRTEAIEKKYCVGCDTLQVENDRLRAENSRLLDKILNVPSEIRPEIKLDELVPIQSRHVPLSVRREQYEREDRRLAERLKREAPKADTFNKEEELKRLEELELEIKNA